MSELMINQIDDALNKINEIIQREVKRADTHDAMKEVLTYVTDNPGKMVSSKLMLLMGVGCNEVQMKKLLYSAASVEMMHTTALILDDIIDESEIRRGKATVQAKYGKPIAICGGNYLLAMAFCMLGRKGYADMADELADMVEHACSGEMFENLHTYDTEVTEEDYLAVVKGKTAYAFGGACRMSARITEKSDEEIYAAQQFGEAVGTIFQLRDDLLDWTMTEEELGKPVNTDFINGLYTLPALYTFRQEEYGDKLREYAKRGNLSANDLRVVRGIVNEAGGITYASAYIRECAEEARRALMVMPENDGVVEMRRILSRLFDEE